MGHTITIQLTNEQDTLLQIEYQADYDAYVEKQEAAGLPTVNLVTFIRTDFIDAIKVRYRQKRRKRIKGKADASGDLDIT